MKQQDVSNGEPVEAQRGLPLGQARRGFSGGSLAADTPQLADAAAFKQKVRVLFVSYGSREAGGAATAKANHEALEKMGIKNIYYESPETAHEWQTWRRDLNDFAPRLFR